MCSEARMFNPYHFNLDGLADDTRFDPYHCPGVHLSGSNVLLTALILVIRPRWFDAAGAAYDFFRDGNAASRNSILAIPESIKAKGTSK